MKCPIVFLIISVGIMQHVRSFTPTISCLSSTPPSSRRCMTSANTEKRRMGELTSPEQKVYDVMMDLSESGYSFRIVVVGKGAILESTIPSLGPTVKVSQSPSTGANLLTFATKDQTFEYHLQLSQVSKIVLVEKETPAKTMRIIRLLNAEGESMSSLILADTSDAATKWYHSFVEANGNEIQL